MKKNQSNSQSLNNQPSKMEEAQQMIKEGVPLSIISKTLEIDYCDIEHMRNNQCNNSE